MSFVDSVQQYQNSVSSGSQNPGLVRDSGSVRDSGAVRQVNAQTQGLTPGKVFEGTVTDIKNGQVTIGLNDGQTISARMDAGVSLEKGQPMIFEVKSNNGEQIAIRPVSLESAQNPTLLKALEAAGIKVNERNISMVNQMMAEQLPINKQSLLQMMRTLSAFPKADIQTLVQMQKLGFVITEDSLNQFQNYKNGQQAILPEMTRLMDGLAELPNQIFGSSGNGQAAQMLGLQQQILGILLEGAQQPSTESQMGNVQDQTVMNGTITGEGVTLETQPGAVATEGQGNLAGAITGEGQGNPAGAIAGEAQGNLAGAIAGEGQGNPAGTIAGEAQGNLAGAIAGEAQGNLAGAIAGETALQEGVAGSQAESGTIAQRGENGSPVMAAQVLSAEQQGNLTSILQEFSGVAKEQILADGKLDVNQTASELLRQIMGVLDESQATDGAAMQKLFRSDAYKNLLKQAMTEQWMLTPEQLKEEGVVKDLYQRLNSQMSELQQALAHAGKEGSALAKSAQSVQSNLEFMNQVNQLYTYVQLPLKLQNQNAHSDLYVYTNKKNLNQKDGELTALLHLDMDHLGATDIFVKLLGTSVQTEFYFEDEFSCRLISQYSDDLIKRLEEKGYSCEVKVENRKKEQNFVQDFLERENPPAKLHRYSFDVKA